MARPLRIEYPGAVYHVTSRGNDRQAIYETKADRYRFLKLLEQACKRHQWSVYAYCLMDNHYHLLIETREATLSKGMRHLNGVYTQWYNNTRKEKRFGHLFQGRYKAILVDRDNYLLELSRYIVLNPIRAKMVSELMDYPWSSYRAMVGYFETGDWLAVDWMLGQFSKQKKRAIAKYQDFVEEGIGQSSPLKQLQGQLVLGSDQFVTKALRKLPKAKQKELSEIPKKQRRKVYVLSSYFKGDNRDQSIAAAYYSGGYSQREIGEYLGLHYSTVSQRLKAYEAKTGN
ncbi:MAG: transposase [Kangiellaceae bacterium]|jgi:putative transposase